MMETELFIITEFETFISSWGCLAVPLPYNGGWIMPLGWEAELTARGVEFEVIEIEQNVD